MLEEEINGHKNQVIQKTRELNKLVTIARLPPELLTEIFLHYAAVIRSSFSYYASGIFGSGAMHGPRSKRWIRIAHVCHHWREVALGSPRLWSEFSVDRLDWTTEMLSRSKKAPLHLTVLALHNVSEALKLALKELPRIESLVFKMCSMDSVTNQLQLGTEAPLLKSLAIASNRPSLMSIAPDAQILFDKVDLPRLTHLELQDTRISWHNPIFKSTLTHLHFRSSDSLYEYQSASIHCVLRALESMPALQTLELKGVLPSLPDDAPPLIDDHALNLPQLQTLVLAAPAKTSAFILRHVSFPATTTLQLECSDYRPSEVAHLFPVLSSKFRPDSGDGAIIAPLLSLSVSELSLKAWTQEYPMDVLDPAHAVPPPAKAKAKLCITLTRISVCTSMFFSNLLAALPLENIRTMHFSSNDFVMDKKEWIRTCEGMTALRELCVSRYGEVGLPEALAARVPIPGAAPPVPTEGTSKRPRRKMQPFLPNLRTLHLSGIRIRSSPPDGVLEGLVPAYVKMLAARRKSKVPLAMLLRECINVGQSDVDKFKKDAACVEWDGREDWIDEDDYDEDEYYDEYYDPYDDYSDDEPPFFFFPW